MSSLNHGYWKSLADLAPTGPDESSAAPGVAGDVAADAPTDAAADAAAADAPIDPLSRRNFVHLMGASFALAGVAGAGCKRWEREDIVPLARRPEDRIPGVTQEYASAYELAGHAQALVVTSYEGRPIKVDGNPEHPFAGSGPGTGLAARHGASTAFAQGSVLDMYDPDRSKRVQHSGQGATFADFAAWISELRQSGRPHRIRVLSEATSSPTVAALRRRLAERMPGLRWHEWEPVSYDNERAGMKLVFGRAVRPIASLDQAETIVALDCDFFMEHPAALRYARDFARTRHPEHSSLGRGRMSRLYAVESSFTSTGVVADHRLPLRSEHVLPFLQALEAALQGGTGTSSAVVNETKVARFLKALADELRKNAGRAVLLAGRKQPPVVHALVARLNQSLAGGLIQYREDPEPDRPSHVDSLAQLVKDINQSQVETLFIIGGNPVFDGPADLGVAEALAKVTTSVHLSTYANETSARATWHVPRAHYLEAWGDARTWDGTYTIQQPLIAPMYGGISAIELLAMLAGDDSPSDKIVARTFAESGAGGTWREAVHWGFVDRTQFPPAQVQAASLPPTTVDSGGSEAINGQLEVTFLPSTHTWDGRFANNSWLRETPDFLTKLTWDNAALISPDTADRLGVKSQDVVRVKLGDRQVEVVALVMPGQARGSIGLVLGGGRTAAGKVGNKGGEYKGGGFNVYPVRTSAALDLARGGTVEKTGRHYKLATTQDHFDIITGMALDPQFGNRELQKKVPHLVREIDREGFTDPSWQAAEEMPYYHDHDHGRGYSLYKEKSYEGRRWAMAIDLGACMGCNACVVACTAENNVPVVGKREVMRNREMQWIRIDRYFKGDMNDPEVVSQPVACQHCENAPCETVCPVGATLHSSEGLNDMVYNRCVGTRYCLNNCPYRVRRFNFFDYHKEFKDARNRVRKLVFNPEVTVRERGVMEKCTYCVQRIQNAKIKAKNDRNRGPLPDGTITTACEAACPTQAITFGDLSDPDSRVSKAHGDRRQYELLAEFNDKPRTRFLARIRNPNPALAQAPAPAHH